MGENVFVSQCFKEFHRFDLNLPDNREFYLQLLQNPALVGLNEDVLVGKSQQQRIEMIVGEYLAQIGLLVNKLAGDLVFAARWADGESEWFDHRLHLLDQEKWFTDFWAASADNIIGVLPLGGTLLNLCSGDGFYDYYFYRKRAGAIVAVELNQEALEHARRLHSASNITYLHENVLTFDPPEAQFDVVAIRGAIEHFNRQDQHTIMQKAAKALKVGGWFCGDTPARRENDRKHLSMHEFEWADEQEMRRELGAVFQHIETGTLASEKVTTLFWRCRK